MTRSTATQGTERGPLYTIDEARTQLGRISRNTIYDLLRNGELASVQIGRRRFIPAAVLEAFIAGATTTVSPSLGPARHRRAVQMPLDLPAAATGRRRGAVGQ